jgi:hypothetical protein
MRPDLAAARVSSSAAAAVEDSEARRKQPAEPVHGSTALVVPIATTSSVHLHDYSGGIIGIGVVRRDWMMPHRSRTVASSVHRRR